ncbi:MAG TPA: WXG100 family type VII secretion target [Pseudonocardiaceae bacterium]
MNSGFSADPAKLRQHGTEFAGHAERAGEIHRQLSQAVTDAGDCWGDDEAGRAFAASYAQPAQDTLSKLGALPGGLADVGDRFTGTADRYEQTETDNAASLREQD